MRFIHTSDWHLGRILHGVHLTEDQAHVLAQFVDLVREVAPDAVLIAGDVFDRAVPPPEAVSLLDEVLSRLVLDCGVHVCVIAGNHDSPERLAFGHRLFSRQKLHVAGSVSATPEPLVIEDGDGAVCFYAVPYAEPPVVREACLNEDIHDQQAALDELLARVRAVHPRQARSVLVAHAFVAGGVQSESERPLTVGGTGAVAVSSLDGFDYVALGHLHRPQAVGSGRVQYSGSLLKYSFSEADHEKIVNIVEMDGQGQCRVRPVSLTPRRDLRRVRGKLKELLNDGSACLWRDAYLSVELLDEGAIFDAIGQLRQVYPNVLEIERPFLDVETSGTGLGDHRRIDDLELFGAFFAQVTGVQLSDGESDAYRAVVNQMRLCEREVGT